MQASLKHQCGLADQPRMQLLLINTFDIIAAAPGFIQTTKTAHASRPAAGPYILLYSLAAAPLNRSCIESCCSAHWPLRAIHPSTHLSCLWPLSELEHVANNFQASGHLQQQAGNSNTHSSFDRCSQPNGTTLTQEEARTGTQHYGRQTIQLITSKPGSILRLCTAGCTASVQCAEAESSAIPTACNCAAHCCQMLVLTNQKMQAHPCPSMIYNFFNWSYIWGNTVNCCQRSFVQ